MKMHKTVKINTIVQQGYYVFRECPDCKIPLLKLDDGSAVCEVCGYKQVR